VPLAGDRVAILGLDVSSRATALEALRLIKPYPFSEMLVALRRALDAPE
jgi:hypothetical protein